MSFHAFDYYLLRLPKMIDVESLSLLQILLARRDNEIKEDQVKSILSHKFFDPTNQLVPLEEFKM